MGAIRPVSSLDPNLSNLKLALLHVWKYTCTHSCILADRQTHIQADKTRKDRIHDNSMISSSLRELRKFQMHRAMSSIIAFSWIRYCNIGVSRFELVEVMSGSRFFSFMRHCGFVNEVKSSKIIANIRVKAREARRRHKMPPLPAEVIEKSRAYHGPGALTPANIDILFTKVQRKNKYGKSARVYSSTSAMGLLHLISPLCVSKFANRLCLLQTDQPLSSSSHVGTLEKWLILTVSASS